MRKSIYEETLEKIDVEFDAWDKSEHLELFELVEYALRQAEKQERLLGLYRELITLKAASDLEKQIKELEK